MTEHLLRFRLLNDAELAAEKTRLSLLNSGFSQQAMGTKNYTIAVGQLTDQLNAIAFVQRERGGEVVPTDRSASYGVGVTDFEQIK